ncbi:MAG: hypothetical protein JWP87_4299 [Labilithrix sp.]|nr:hypothetical protein [Labilithrix sp.]
MSSASTYEASTVLELGGRGKHRGVGFVLAGRTCVRSDGGGLWNEWTLVFDDGRQGFLAEALGSFTLFFERPIAPAFESLGVGSALETGFIVAERGHAKRVARWGEVPEAPRTYRYADLSSRDGQIATIDYGATEPDVFVGRRTKLADLGLQPRAERPRFLPAPSAPRPKGLELFLAVGDEGELARARYRVIGIVHRSIRALGERYTWEEYVLHAPAEGLRWLVVADGHWNLVESVEPGLVEEVERGKSAKLGGETYRFLSSGKARVEWATGELPWEIEIGDVTDARDYVRAPHVLSCESTDDELTWSLGTYTPPDTVARAFGKRVLPKPTGRAANQPKPPGTPKRR